MTADDRPPRGDERLVVARPRQDRRGGSGVCGPDGVIRTSSGPCSSCYRVWRERAAPRLAQSTQAQAPYTDARSHGRAPGRTVRVQCPGRLPCERAVSGSVGLAHMTPRISVTKTRVSPPRMPACGTPRSP